MIIKSMRIKNFRSIVDQTLCIDNLTALIGPNGSGKSTFLYALNSFFNVNSSSHFDFYNNDTKNDIEISLTFSNIADETKKIFKKYVQNNEMTVMKIIKFEDIEKFTIKYHGLLLKNIEFDVIRNAQDAKKKKENYNNIKSNYDDLDQDCTTASKIEIAITDWEDGHPEKCTLSADDGSFFGNNGNGMIHLKKCIDVLLIPAVHDAVHDVTEGTKSPLTILVDHLVRRKLEENKDFVELQQNSKKNYEKIIEDNGDLSKLSNSLTKMINNYVIDASVDLQFVNLDFKISLPSVAMQLIEGGHKSIMQNTGHGLQRIFIMIMMEFMSKTNKSSENDKSESPTLVFLIDEPELYQHPNRQRKIFDIFYKLAFENIESSYNIQILYSTHSSYFIGLKIIENIRLLKKINHDNNLAKMTTIISANLKKLSDELNTFASRRFTIDNIKPRLHTLETHWIREGFFSKCIVLVEGHSDKEIIMKAANMHNLDLDGNDISIIPCLGKQNLDKSLMIFRQFGLPTYTIWDNDRKYPYEDMTEEARDKMIQSNNSAEKFNKKLLKLHNSPEEKFPVCVKDDYACFEIDIENIFKKHMGDKFDKLIQKIKTENDLYKEKVFKNPITVSLFIDELKSCELTMPATLEEIILKIKKLS